MRPFVILIIIGCLLPSLAIGQYAINLVPRISPDRSTSLRIAYTELKVFYGAPSVNGRSVLGELIPYQTVWRAGANEATRFETSQTIYFAKDSLVAGEYALFIIAQAEGPWTVIFSKKAKQWGAFRYDEADDALRIEVLPQKGAFQEQLTYSLHKLGEAEGQLRLAWENIILPINFKIDYQAQFQAQVLREAAKRDTTTRWVVFLQGADYLCDQGQNLTLALEWLRISEELSARATPWNAQFYPKHYLLGHLYWTRAKVYAQKGDYAKAHSYAMHMVEMRQDYNYFDKKGASERVNELMAEWREKF
ncbi:MAG: DUF2911 domain-containing protein [Bacteroidota bacterium]